MGPKSPPGTRGVKPAESVPFWAVTDIRLKRAACEELENAEEYEAPHSLQGTP